MGNWKLYRQQTVETTGNQVARKEENILNHQTDRKDGREEYEKCVILYGERSTGNTWRVKSESL